MACTPRLVTTPAIVSVNVLVFIAMIATGVSFFAPTVQSVLDWGANFGPKTMNGQWWRLVTSMFLHYGILHLAFNMWVLWDLGRLVERLVGNVGFVVLYFVSGIAGSIASLAWNPVVVSAGASGAVFGVAGALVGLLIRRRDTIPTVVLKQLRNSMGAFLLYNIVFGLTIPGIDMAAHIGGFVAGFACGVVLSQPLAVEMLARRKWRNAAVVTAGTVVLFLAASALPDAPPDVHSALQRFGEMEQRILDKYNDLVRSAQQGTISDDEFADAVQRDVLPQWRKSLRQIELLAETPHVDRARFARLVEYMKTREESWSLRVQGIRQQDASKIDRADERSLDADEIAKELSNT